MLLDHTFEICLCVTERNREAGKEGMNYKYSKIKHYYVNRAVYPKTSDVRNEMEKNEQKREKYCVQQDALVFHDN